MKIFRALLLAHFLLFSLAYFAQVSGSESVSIPETWIG
jgi:hypothetical protein